MSLNSSTKPPYQQYSNFNCSHNVSLLYLSNDAVSNEAVWLQHSVSPWGTSLKGGETVDVTCTERDHPPDQTSNKAKKDNTALVIL